MHASGHYVKHGSLSKFEQTNNEISAFIFNKYKKHDKLIIFELMQYNLLT